MKRLARFILFLLPVIVLAFAPAVADARSIFDVIFGRKQEVQPVYPPPPPPVKKKRVIKTPAPQKTNQKAQNAKRILFWGILSPMLPVTV